MEDTLSKPSEHVSLLGCVLNKLSCLTYRYDIVELFQKKVKIVQFYCCSFHTVK